MPVYEYICEEDGTRIELIRPMRDADAPVEDPERKGRKFTRAMSEVMVGKAATGSSLPMTGPGQGPGTGGMCGCGRRHGSCGS